MTSAFAGTVGVRNPNASHTREPRVRPLAAELDLSAHWSIILRIVVQVAVSLQTEHSP